MYKHFDMEREKNTYAAVSEKKLRKVELCFMTGCFIKPFNMIINHFFLFGKLTRSPIFAF